MLLSRSRSLHWTGSTISKMCKLSGYYYRIIQSMILVSVIDYDERVPSGLEKHCLNFAALILFHVFAVY